MIVITEQLMVENHREGGRMWNFRQLACLGVEIPLRTGWFKRLIGKQVSDEDWQRFQLAGKDIIPDENVERPGNPSKARRIVFRALEELGKFKGQQGNTIGSQVLASEYHLATTNSVREFTKSQARKYLVKVAYQLSQAKTEKPKSQAILKRTFSGGQKPLIDPAYSKASRDDFFASSTWKELRYMVLVRDKATCQCCNRSRKDGVTIQVDHIIPVSIDFSKRADPNNLQCLCADCNEGKGNRSNENWR